MNELSRVPGSPASGLPLGSVSRLEAAQAAHASLRPLDLDLLRGRILTPLLYGAGLLALAFFCVYLALHWGEAFSAYQVAFGATTAVLLSLAAVRQIPYPVKAGFFLLLLLAGGLSILTAGGRPERGLLILLAAAILATILFGLRLGMILLGLATGALVAIALTASRVPLADSPSPQADGLMSAMVFLVIGLAVTLLLGLFLRGLEASLQAQGTLAIELDGERRQLENRVARRTRDLERRLVQVRTAAEISRALGSVLDPQALLDQVVALVRERFDLYYVGAFRVDPPAPAGRSRWASLAAASGPNAGEMLASGHRLLVGGDSMVGWAAAHNQARIAQDVGQEAIRFNNPHLPATRAELAIPFGSGGRVTGALTIQSDQPQAFDQDDILILQGIADSLAIALENARLFSTVQTSLDEIQGLHRRYLAQGWSAVVERARSRRALTCTYEEPGPQPASAPAFTRAIPLELRGQVIGQLTLESDRPFEAGGAEDATWMETVAAQAALALENARLLEETRRRADQEKTMGDIAGKLWATTDVDRILETALGELARALGVSSGQIRLEPPADPGGKELAL